MPGCPVCGAERSREELAEEVFHVDGRYVLVGRVPARVCVRCGERSFSRETAERVRGMAHGDAKPIRAVPLAVFEFTPGAAAASGTRDAGRT